MYEVTEVTQKR